MIGKYTVNVWWDGEILIHDRKCGGGPLFRSYNIKHLTEEYIDKILLLM
jgi:hypothetical protein